jgi:hypothetical protein
MENGILPASRIGNLLIAAVLVTVEALSLLAIGLVFLLDWQSALVMHEELDKVSWASREAGSTQVLTIIVT